MLPCLLGHFLCAESQALRARAGERQGAARVRSEDGRGLGTGWPPASPLLTAGVDAPAAGLVVWGCLLLSHTKRYSICWEEGPVPFLPTTCPVQPLSEDAGAGGGTGDVSHAGSLSHGN